MMRFSLLAFFSLASFSAPLYGADQPNQQHVTVYQNGLAFIEDRRTLDLSANQTQVLLPAISPQIIPESLLLTIQGQNVLSRRLDFDVLTPSKLLHDHIGKTVTFIDPNGDPDLSATTTGTLLALDGDKSVLRLDDGSLISGDFGYLSLPKESGPYITQPSLSATITPAQDSRSLAQLGYLTSGFTWSTSYSLTVSDQGDQVTLSPWANLRNSSGLDYDQVQISLAAGQVNRHSPTPRPTMMKTMMRAEVADSAMPNAPDSVGSALKLYQLPNAIDLPHGQMVQISLMPSQTFRSVRHLVARFHPLYGPVSAEQAQPIAPRIELQFTNTSEHALPSGQVRLYQKGKEARLIFAGETQLAQHSKGDEITLSSAESFDVSVTRQQTEFTRQGKQGFTATYIQTIQNKSERTELVRIEDSFPEGWQLLSSSLQPDHQDSRSAHWTISVPQDSTLSLTYKISVPERR